VQQVAGPLVLVLVLVPVVLALGLVPLAAVDTSVLSCL